MYLCDVISLKERKRIVPVLFKTSVIDRRSFPALRPICGWQLDRFPLCWWTVRYRSANKDDSAFYPPWVDNWVVMQVFTRITEVEIIQRQNRSVWLWVRVRDRGFGLRPKLHAGVMHYIIPPRNLSGRMTFARRKVIRPVVKVPPPRRERTYPLCNL